MAEDGPVRVIHIPSASREGEHHRVELACDCRGWRYAGHCRHIELAAVALRHAARSRLEG